MQNGTETATKKHAAHNAMNLYYISFGTSAA